MARLFLSQIAGTVLVIGLGLGGCGGPFGWTRVTVNRPLTATDIAFIVPGKTTLHEVTDRLGAPDDVMGRRTGFVAEYFDYDGRSFRINFGWPLGFIAPARYAPHDLAFAGQGIGVHTFAVAFDERGRAQYAEFIRAEAGSSWRWWPFD
jgi:hypothetical protein